jgi:hypothetical protein
MLMMDKVFQAIINKWPMGEYGDPNFVIKVQQDGAGGHCNEDDPELLEYLQSIGWLVWITRSSCIYNPQTPQTSTSWTMASSMPYRQPTGELLLETPFI